MPEMIEWARQKALRQGVSIDWVVADARTFQLQKQFPFIYMLENVFQFFLTRADQEAMLARVREHGSRRDVFSLKHAIPPHGISCKSAIQTHQSTRCLMEGNS